MAAFDGQGDMPNCLFIVYSTVFYTCRILRAMAFIRAPHSRASMPPASLAPPRQQLACATSQPSRKPAAAIRALPANPSIALDPALPESCRYGTSVRGAAIAVGAPAARVPPTGKKTRKGKKQRGNLAKAKVKAAQVQQAEEEEERGSVDVVWVPDGHGGSRRVHLSKFRTLMLDSSYRPVSVINWQKAVRAAPFDASPKTLPTRPHANTAAPAGPQRCLPGGYTPQPAERAQPGRACPASSP